MDIRAKFKLNQIVTTKGEYGASKSAVFAAVGADGVPENQRYHKYTPSGKLEIYIDNPPVIEFLEANIGKEFYLDFSVASA